MEGQIYDIHGNPSRVAFNRNGIRLNRVWTARGVIIELMDQDVTDSAVLGVGVLGYLSLGSDGLGQAAVLGSAIIGSMFLGRNT